MQTFRAFLQEARLPSSLLSWSRKQVQTLTPEERALLIDYANEGYYNINLYLRHAGNIDAMRKQASRTMSPNIYAAAKKRDAHLSRMLTASQMMDGIFAKFRLPQALTVYRGTDEQLPMFSKPTTLVGKTLTLPGFTSTSTSSAIAKDWDFNRGILLAITLPPGAHAIPMIPEIAGESSEEAEVILPQNTQAVVTKVIREDGGIYEDYWRIEARMR